MANKGPLNGVYNSSLEWVKEIHTGEEIYKTYKEFYVEPTKINSIPKTIEKNIHWKFVNAMNSTPPPAFVLALDNGRVVSYNGAIISPNNKLIWDVSIEFIVPSPDKHPLLEQTCLPSLKYTDEKIAALTFCASQYYYHWLFDVLPRFYLLEHMGVDVDKFAINWNGRPHFQEETLNLLGIPKEKIITVTEETNLQSRNLFVPSLPGQSGHMGKWTIDFLRSKLLKNHLVKNGARKTPKRIYISRAKASTRNVTNEKEVIKLLSRFGFKTVYLENLSVIEQVNLFANAGFIIAPHGGGLSNITFCKPGTKVIEFLSPNYVHTCYWVIANHVKADYYYLIGKGDRPPENIDPNSVHQNIEIDLKDLCKICKMAGIKK